MMARVTRPLRGAWEDFSTLARTAETPLSQATSMAPSSGIEVVVGAAVVAVVGAADGGPSSVMPAWLARAVGPRQPSGGMRTRRRNPPSVQVGAMKMR